MTEEIQALDAHIGRRIRDARKKRRWTLMDLSEKLGISYQQVQKYEQGITRVPASSLFLLAQLFTLNSDYFFSGYETQQKPLLDEDNNLISTAKTRPLSLLLIEDDPEDALLFQRCIDDLDKPCQVYTLHDGEQALSFLLDRKAYPHFKKPDLVFLDFNLPKVNATQFLKEIKKDPKTRHLPVIIVSNSVSRNDMMASYKNYAAGYICKSFDVDEFRENLARTLDFYYSSVVLPMA